MAAAPTGVIFYDGRAKPLSTTGQIQPGAYYQFYLTQTLTLATVYADGNLTTPLSQTPGTGGTTAASDGRLPVIFLSPSVTYRYQLYSSTGVLLEDIDPYIPAGSATVIQTLVAVLAALYVQTSLTESAGGGVSINAALGNQFIVTVTDTTAFSVNAPTNPTTGQTITITIKNASGGVMGAVTWNAIFKGPPTLWVNPANGFNASVSLVYNGTNWVELWQSPADIPN